VLPGSKEQCLDAGMDAYYAKPIQIEEIQNIVRSAAQNSNETAEKLEDFRLGLEKLRAIGGDVFVADIVRSYLVDVSKELQRLQAAAVERNAAAVQRAAHAIKGCSNLITAEAIAETCRELEAAATAGSFIAVDNIIARLNEQCRQLANDLRELLTAGSGL
jgi:HPt (histidine-containing phosphotransfer) domain-containing protein